MADEIKLDTKYTFFGDPNRQFPPVQDDNSIDVVQFIAASEIMPKFFVHMGKQFMFVRKDIQLNVDKIKAAHQLFPECKTLKEILEVEIGKYVNVQKKDSSCVVALLWFRRGLLFMYLLLRQLVEHYNNHGNKIPDSSVNAARLSYKNSLKNHHNIVVRGLVSAANQFLPTPTNMVMDLGFQDEAKMHQVIKDTEAMLDLLKPCLVAILGYYKENKDLSSLAKDESADQCDAWKTPA